MGNIKHSGDCCCFIIYEALVISYINNPWLQSVAGTVIEYSWGIFVENFHHHFKPGHKNKNNPNKNFNCVISQFPPLRNKIFLFLPPTKLFLWGGVVEQNSRVNLEGRLMLDWKEAGTSCIQLYVLSLNMFRMLHLAIYIACMEHMQIPSLPPGNISLFRFNPRPNLREAPSGITQRGKWKHVAATLWKMVAPCCWGPL